MRKTIFVTGLLSFISNVVMADQAYNNPTVSSRAASSADFPQENDFNNNVHSSTPKKAKKKTKKAAASKPNKN
jgi:hypothetical protein